MMIEKVDRFKVDKEVVELIDSKFREALELCQIYKVPMFATFVTENNELETKYDNIVYNGASHLINLQEDNIRKHMLVSNGFEVVPARDCMTMDLTDLT